METFKANFLIFIFIIITLGLGYWAVIGIKSSTDNFIADQKTEDVGPVVVTTPSEDIPKTETPVSVPEVVVDTPEVKEEPKEVIENPEKDDDADLIADLQDLIDDNILMKKGSKGTRVGTVQKFLIRYGVSMKVDNDYGDTTVNSVKKFQTEQKLGADGQTGKETYQKMIDWLKNN